MNVMELQGLSETTLQIIAGLKLLWVAGFAVLYGIGGMWMKWVRRYAGPTWITGGILLFSLWAGTFRPWFMAYPLLLMGALHMGYGVKDNDTGHKIIRRALAGLAVGVSAAPLLFTAFNWGLFAVHVGLCLLASILFGVFGLFGNARSEETAIGLFAVLIPMFMI